MDTPLDTVKAVRRMSAKRRKFLGGMKPAGEPSRTVRTPGLVFASSLPEGIKIVRTDESGRPVVTFIRPDDHRAEECGGSGLTTRSGAGETDNPDDA